MDSPRSDDQNVALTNLVFLLAAQDAVGIFRRHDDLKRGMPVRRVIFRFIIIIKTDLSVRAIGNRFMDAG